MKNLYFLNIIISVIIYIVVLAALVLMHLIGLHDTGGSSNPMGVSGNLARLPMGPYYLPSFFRKLCSIYPFFNINLMKQNKKKGVVGKIVKFRGPLKASDTKLFILLADLPYG